MGEVDEVPHAARIEIAQKLLHQAIKRPELKDELYMHLVKQTRGNPNHATKLKAWELFHLVASTVPPSKDFVGLVSEYIHSVAHDESEAPELRAKAELTWQARRGRTRGAGRRAAVTSPRLTRPRALVTLGSSPLPSLTRQQGLTCARAGA